MMKALSVTLHLTHHCNLRCSYCFTGEKLPIAMSFETIDQTVSFIHQELEKSGTNKLHVTFFGGEPLIEKQKIFYAIEKFNRLKGLDVSYRMSTNGTLLNANLMQKLIDSSVYMSLSIDGHPAVHDKHRIDAGGHSTSAKVEQAARWMLAANPATNVTCVISPDTASALCESVDYIYQLGFKYITTTLDYSADWRLEHFAQIKKSYQKLSNWYIEKMLANERFYLSFFDERIRQRTYKPITANERCQMGTKQFSIAPNGELYPCIQFVKTKSLPEFMIGHVGSGFDSKCQTHIHDLSEKEKPECKGCQLESRCSKWCSCVNFMSTGRIDKASPIVCYNEKILIEIVDKTADKLWKMRNNHFVHKHYNEDYPILSHLEITI